jgi:cytochrome bd ubiquinol oxidase subunit I
VDALDLARLQFGIVTVYHFIFVPLSIGLAMIVAVMQTMWYRSGKPNQLRATKFWGKLFLINFAMGVVTGLVQEFQFGMNWSSYSRFVGDVFGAPLAMEGLLAFFVEATFLGLWIFGWERLPRGVHLACIWLVSIGTLLSAYFILSANAWMQHPVGYRLDPVTGKARLTDIGAVLFQSTTLVAVFHTFTAAFMTGGAFVVGVSAWHLARRHETEVFRSSLKLGLWISLVASLLVVVSGDVQAKIMTEQQPMKMAAAEALYANAAPASFSVFTIGSLSGREEIWSLRVPYVLSFMATGEPTAEVEGINDVQRESEQRFGPGDYRPNIPVTYWNFRLMIGFGLVVTLISLAGLWLTRGRRAPRGRWFWRLAVFAIAAPFLANTAGWIFTEMGRQPWVVYGTMFTAAGVSPTVSTAEVTTSLLAFTVLYGGLAAVDAALMARYARSVPPAAPAEEPEESDVLAFAY